MRFVEKEIASAKSLLPRRTVLMYGQGHLNDPVTAGKLKCE
jgi:hypothetical protein